MSDSSARFAGDQAGVLGVNIKVYPNFLVLPQLVLSFLILILSVTLPHRGRHGLCLYPVFLVSGNSVVDGLILAIFVEIGSFAITAVRLLSILLGELASEHLIYCFGLAILNTFIGVLRIIGFYNKEEELKTWSYRPNLNYVVCGNVNNDICNVSVVTDDVGNTKEIFKVNDARSGRRRGHMSPVDEYLTLSGASDDLATHVSQVRTNYKDLHKIYKIDKHTAAKSALANYGRPINNKDIQRFRLGDLIRRCNYDPSIDDDDDDDEGKNRPTESWVLGGLELVLALFFLVEGISRAVGGYHLTQKLSGEFGIPSCLLFVELILRLTVFLFFLFFGPPEQLSVLHQQCDFVEKAKAGPLTQQSSTRKNTGEDAGSLCSRFFCWCYASDPGRANRECRRAIYSIMICPIFLYIEVVLIICLPFEEKDNIMAGTFSTISGLTSIILGAAYILEERSSSRAITAAWLGFMAIISGIGQTVCAVITFIYAFEEFAQMVKLVDPSID